MDGEAELKPCPFCGAKALVMLNPVTMIFRIACSASLKKCGMNPFTESSCDKSKVASQWNTRAALPDADLKAAIAGLVSRGTVSAEAGAQALAIIESGS